AEGHVNTAIGMSPKDASLYKDLGKILYAKPDYEETVKALAKCHEMGSGDHLTYYMLGKALQKGEKPNEAIAAFEKSVQLQKKNYNAYFALGQIFLSQGKYLSAANHFDQALKASPTKHLAAYNYAVAVESNEPENYTQNIEAWERFVRLAKNNPKAKAGAELAEAENHLKELKEAKKQKDLQ
ncbi:MAG: tetratricopeptide repeat protein, partial [Candidatus Zixiibacteriota bacterium]